LKSDCLKLEDEGFIKLEMRSLPTQENKPKVRYYKLSSIAANVPAVPLSLLTRAFNPSDYG
jgi:hypothetical protein